MDENNTFFFLLTAVEAKKGFRGFQKSSSRWKGKLYIYNDITNKQTLQLIQEKLYLSLK